MGHSNSLPNGQLINQNNEAQHYAIVSLIEETCQVSYNNHVAGGDVDSWLYEDKILSTYIVQCTDKYCKLFDARATQTYG